MLLFFFPILLGTFFQQLYNTVDAVIVGHFIVEEALAAVGGAARAADPPPVDSNADSPESALFPLQVSGAFLPCHLFIPFAVSVGAEF